MTTKEAIRKNKNFVINDNQVIAKIFFLSGSPENTRAFPSRGKSSSFRLEISSSKSSGSIPRNSCTHAFMKFSKTLEASIKAQVAAEQRAHQIVEKLVLEEFATPEYFLEIGNYITHRHYSDVVTERFIIKICGYPLCPKSLTNIPKQTFKISTRTNRVYDITERKDRLNEE
ncbi:predicted protein [Nematostella vectensis]|uniref:RNA polymerase II subunit B1 CTD phosphatase RPAP2 homolog n=1 Tax=Nematostella vectensis TaxID=45351 RepID=A7RWF2_NEMVE|nr:predicted protein [Nematostella vectensis]|eukprot:XP_001636369.1 predicted protein [Nematostella vectensis]